MSHRKANESADTSRSTASSGDVSREHPLADTRQVIAHEIPQGVDRRSFLMRAAVGGAAAVMTGCAVSPEDKDKKAAATAKPAAAAAAPPLAADLNVVKKGQGPVLTTVDEFYKVGPG